MPFPHPDIQMNRSNTVPSMLLLSFLPLTAPCVAACGTKNDSNANPRVGIGRQLDSTAPATNRNMDGSSGSAASGLSGGTFATTSSSGLGMS